MAKSRLHELSAAGVSVWIDSLSREMLASGELARLMEEDAVVGVTSNPTIFQKALSEGDRYDAQLREVAAVLDDPNGDLLRTRSRMTSARRATSCAPSGSRPAASTAGSRWRSTRRSPTTASAPSSRLSASTRRSDATTSTSRFPPRSSVSARSRTASRRASRSTSRSSSRSSATGRSRRRTCAVWSALVAAGGDPSRVLSVASFFVSRVDSEADKRLEAIGRPDLQGKLAIANAKLAYQHYLATFAGERWDFLAGKGARPQRCLWASTSTKNPAYRDVLYVEELIGPDTVNTMPIETVRAFQDHGEIRGATLTGRHRRGEAAARRSGGGGRRLRRRRRDARGRGRDEVRRLVRRAARGDRREVGCLDGGVTVPRTRSPKGCSSGGDPRPARPSSSAPRAT